MSKGMDGGPRPSQELGSLFEKLNKLPSMFPVDPAPVDGRVIYGIHPTQTLSSFESHDVLRNYPRFKKSERDIIGTDGIENLVLTGLFEIVPKYPHSLVDFNDKSSGNPEEVPDFLELVREQDFRRALAHKIVVDPLTSRFDEPFMNEAQPPQGGAYVARYEIGADQEKPSRLYRVVSHLANHVLSSLAVWVDAGGRFQTVRGVEESEPQLGFGELLGYWGEESSRVERSWALCILSDMADPERPNRGLAEYILRPPEPPSHVR